MRFACLVFAFCLLPCTLPAQSYRPPTTGEKAVIRQAIALIACLADKNCDPGCTLAFFLGAAALSGEPITIGDSDGNAHTTPDYTNAAGDGVFTPDFDNTIVLNEGNFCYNPDGSAQFLSSASAKVSQVCTAGVLFHELRHFDDQNTWPDETGRPSNPGGNNDAEADAYSAELDLLTAALDCPTCIVLSLSEAKEVNDRRKYVEGMINYYTR